MRPEQQELLTDISGDSPYSLVPRHLAEDFRQFFLKHKIVVHFEQGTIGGDQPEDRANFVGTEGEAKINQVRKLMTEWNATQSGRNRN